MTRQPLAGVGVVVTRPREQAESLIASLQAAGGDVVALPLIEIHPRRAPWSAIEVNAVGDADVIVVTSANGARLLAQALACGQLPPLQAQTTIAAVGPATAGELQLHGLVAEVVPDHATGRALVRALDHHGLTKDRAIVLARASAGNPDLPKGLRQAGATVTELPLYTTERVVPDSQTLDDASRAQIWTFHSPSAVDSAVAAIGQRQLAQKAIVVVGPTTAARVHDHDLTVAAQADAPTDAAVTSAVIAVTPGPV